MQKIVLLHKKELIFIAVFYCLCAISFAQETRMLDDFTGDLSVGQQELINTLESHQSTKRTRVATIRKSAFRQAKLTANLFIDRKITFQPHDIGTTGVNNRTWTGISEEKLATAAVIINGNRISAHFASVEGSFEILPLDNHGTHLIIEHSASGNGTCGNNETDPGNLNDSEIQTGENHIQRTPPSGECRIRLLIGYTPGAQANTMATYNRTMIEHVELAILQMNQGYANSLANQRVELAHLYKTTDEETGNSTNDVNNLRNTDDGQWDEIHDLRNLYNADMVALITDGSYVDLCGRAYGFNYELEANMFQITEYNCAVSNFTLAHEFGHLQGCRHNVDANDTPFTYGHGYSQGGVFQTIMAVCCGGARVNYWSNPYVYYPGVGMMGTIDFSYNTQALNASYATIAQHRLAPSSIASDAMLQDDHLTSSSAFGQVVATDIAMSGGYLILQSGTKVRLTPGFRAYNGSLGNFRIEPGCTEPIPLASNPPDEVTQRDARPVSAPDVQLSQEFNKDRIAIANRDKRNN